jgi:hypothetical protein
VPPLKQTIQTFIPSLLYPLTIPPAPYIVPLQCANLQALHTLLATIEKTGRAVRWRGEILNGIGILLVALSERGVSGALDGGKVTNSVGLGCSTGKVGQAIESIQGERQGGLRLSTILKRDTSKLTTLRTPIDQLQDLLVFCKEIISDLVKVAPSMKTVSDRDIAQWSTDRFLSTLRCFSTAGRNTSVDRSRSGSLWISAIVFARSELNRNYTSSDAGRQCLRHLLSPLRHSQRLFDSTACHRLVRP